MRGWRQDGQTRLGRSWYSPALARLVRSARCRHALTGLQVNRYSPPFRPMLALDQTPFAARTGSIVPQNEFDFW
jgi:hypothetical protein